MINKSINANATSDFLYINTCVSGFVYAKRQTSNGQGCLATVLETAPAPGTDEPVIVTQIWRLCFNFWPVVAIFSQILIILLIKMRNTAI